MKPCPKSPTCPLASTIGAYIDSDAGITACVSSWRRVDDNMIPARAKVNGLKRGKMPIFEPGLEELVVKNAAEGRLTFTTNLAEAVHKAEVVFIAVGTPTARHGEGGQADLTYVYAAAQEIAGALKDYTVVVTNVAGSVTSAASSNARPIPTPRHASSTPVGPKKFGQVAS